MIVILALCLICAGLYFIGVAAYHDSLRALALGVILCFIGVFLLP
jgi:hypothetical protein